MTARDTTPTVGRGTKRNGKKNIVHINIYSKRNVQRTASMYRGMDTCTLPCISTCVQFIWFSIGVRLRFVLSLSHAFVAHKRTLFSDFDRIARTRCAYVHARSLTVDRGETFQLSFGAFFSAMMDFATNRSERKKKPTSHTFDDASIKQSKRPK